ncbi:trypsin-like serine protease [Streptomyces sp. BE20]|uniref:trypsin-like serine protease n=1 Tax=Streptomyces sp. BE20 TaxID=3002525 RepID=UPI002E7A6734|nr:trypsin-like serine protease [Streptomyces sp. BE20]MEE1826309.1 trypsin-like serine protease [Streptomyces sp. BE20]
MSGITARTAWKAALLTTAIAAGSLTTLSASPAGATAGTPATDGSYAYTARIAIGDNFRACTGALVDRYWVITAASCFADNPSQPAAVAETPKWATTVTVGRTDLTATNTGATRSVEKLVARPERDLVMAKLATPIDGIAPLRVATSAPVPAENLRVPAYGRTKTEWVPNKLHSGVFTLNGVRTTAVDTSGTNGAAICKGDTGAPVIRETGTGAELVAVASRSWLGGCLGETETRTGAANSRVDDLDAWIKNLRLSTADVQAGTHVQIIGSDDKLYDSVADYTSGLWTRGWTPTGDSRLLAVDSVATGDTVHVYAVLTDHRVYSRDGKIGGRWGAWSEVPGGAVAADGAQKITAAVRGNTGLVDVEIIGSDGSLYGTTADYGTGTWRPTWGKIGDNRLTAVTSAYYNNATHVFAINEDGKVYTRTGNYTTGSWGADWTELPGSRPGVTSISAAVHGTTVDLSIAGADTFYSTSGHFDTGLWDQQWTPMGDNHLTVLTSTTSDNVVHVYAVNEDKKVYTRDANYNTGLWTAWKEIPGDATGVKAITAATTG